MTNLGDHIVEGLKLGVVSEEQRFKDLIFFLFHCFKINHRLASDSPIIGTGSPVTWSIVFCVLYWSLLSAEREKLQGVIFNESAVKVSIRYRL